MSSPESRLCDVRLDEASLPPATPEADNERRVAVFDLLENNFFHLEMAPGPYVLQLSLNDNRLAFEVSDRAGAAIHTFLLSLAPLRRVIKDYFLICDSYYEAVRTSTPQQIEAIDMGRRGLHNEGSELLMQRLDGKVRLDLETARRLFTLICALHWKG